MHFYDKVPLNNVRRTGEGYLIADARIARSGIYEYAGAEIGRPDLDVVKVYRDQSAVFDGQAMASFAHIPVTDDHPGEFVDSQNWRKYATGFTGGDIARDGDFLRVPLVIKDAAVIDKVTGGKQELSAGYNCELIWEDGKTPSGEAYQARMTDIRANHLAVVTAGRAGPECKIGDGGASDPANTKTAPTTTPKGDHAMTQDNLRTTVVDGISIQTTDQGVQAIDKLKASLKTMADAAEKQKADDTKAFDELQAKYDALEKEHEDAKKSLDDEVAARADAVADAKTITGKAVDAKGKTVADIKREAVKAKLGDKAVEDKSDDYVAVRFDDLKDAAAKDAKAPGRGDPIRRAVGDGVQTQDADGAWSGMCEDLRNRHRPDAGKAAS